MTRIKRLWKPVELLISIASAIAIWGLISWTSNTWQQQSFRVEYFPMSPTTTIVILLLSISAILSKSYQEKRFFKPLYYSVTGIITAHALYIIGLRVFDLGPAMFDHFLSGHRYINDTPIGVMSPVTAIMVLFMVCSIRGAIKALGHVKFWHILGSATVGINVLMALTIVMGYMAGMPFLFGAKNPSMSLFTSTSLLFLSFAIMWLYGSEGWMQGYRAESHRDLNAKPRLQRSGSMYVFISISVLIVVVSQFFLKQSYKTVMENAYHQLEIIGGLKNTQISKWYNDRLTDAKVIYENEMVQAKAIDLIRAKAGSDVRAEILLWMQSRVEHYHYTRFSLFKNSGEQVISTASGEENLKIIYDSYFDKAIKEKRIVVADLQKCKTNGKGQPTSVHLQIWIPILNDSGNAEGAWMLEFDPYLQLFPLIQTWPTYSRTGETILVERRGRDVVILNEAKNQNNTALKLRFDHELFYAMPASMAVKGRIGVVEGLDYRDKPVLAYIGPVEGTPWFTVVKIDRDEIYQPMRQKVWTIWGFVLLMAATSALGLAYWEKNRDKQWLLRQYTLSLEHQQIAERITNLTKYANDIILTLDKDCNIIEANHKAIETYGYSEDELKKLSLMDLVIPSQRELHRKEASNLASAEGILLEATHLARDGRQIEVESSIHSIQVKGNIFQQVIIRDITDKKRAAEAIRISEEKFRKAFTTIPDSITISRGNDGLINMVNDGFTQMTGYTEQEVVGKTTVEIKLWKNPEDREFVVSELSKNSRIRNFEADFIAKHGEIRGLMSATLIDMDNEKYILSVIRDISDKHRAETLIRISEEKFRNLFNNSPEGKSMTSITGEMNVNKAFCDILGYTDKELFAKKWTEVTHPDDIEESKNVVNKLLNGEAEKITYEKRYIHKSGRIVWAEVNTMLQKDADKQPLYFITSISDITPKKLAAEQLQNLTQRLRTIINKAPFGAHTYALDKDDNLIFIGYNLAAETMLNINHEALVGMKLEDAFPMHKHTDIPEICRRVALTGEPYQAIDYLYEGDKVAGTFEIRTIQTGDRQVTSFFVDVTDRQKAEADITALNKTLEQKIFERTIALTTANKELESFSYSISHDLRAPLRGIDGWSQVLLEDYYDKLDEQGEIILNNIRAETQRMGLLIDALLDLSKMSRGEIEFVETNLSQLAQDIVIRLKQTDSSRQIDFIIQPDLVDVCDPRLMDIVLTNLLGNSFKFTKNKVPARIEFGLVSIDGKNAYYIKDNGVGFNMNFSNKLFEAFQRLHKPVDYPGTGIGLATVKRIVSRHGGNVWAKSEPDKYTIFYFTLREEIWTARQYF